MSTVPSNSLLCCIHFEKSYLNWCSFCDAILLFDFFVEYSHRKVFLSKYTTSFQLSPRTSIIRVSGDQFSSMLPDIFSFASRPVKLLFLLHFCRSMCSSFVGKATDEHRENYVINFSNFYDVQ